MDISKILPKKEVKHPQPALKGKNQLPQVSVTYYITYRCNSLAMRQNMLFVTELCHCETTHIGF